MAFNRIMMGAGLPEAEQGIFDFPRERTGIGYMPEHLQGNYTVADGRTDFTALARLPTLFMNEGTHGDEFARVGTAQVVGETAKNISIQYQYDSGIPAIAQDRLPQIATSLGLPWPSRGFSWTHTSWAVVDGDLFQSLIRLIANAGNSPTVFNISSPPRIQPLQVSAMMSFEAAFTPVYEAISVAAASVGAQCNRADNVWEHDVLVQDIASLIDRSRIIVCDVSGRNPNVFYETGVAHALGRQTILITQSGDDVPFDLRHLRYIRYLNNGEGRIELTADLTTRMRTILA